jgi:4-carboxymuconolactone decarboxylase
MRLQTPRIRALPPEEWDEEAKDAFASVSAGPNPLPALNIFRTLANHAKLAKRWLVFGNHILGKNTLPPREREIVILRIGWLCRAEYEWSQHVVIGKREGLSDDEIRRIGVGPEAAGWSELDRALLRATDELWNDAFVSDATWKDLSRSLNTQQLMDLVFTVGQYNLVSMALNSFGVQLDPGLPRMPAEAGG